MKVLVCKTRSELDRRTADWIAGNVEPGRVAALAVGRSVDDAYALLAKRAPSWADVLLTSIDELHPLPSGDRRAFGARLKSLAAATGATLELFRTDASDPAVEAMRLDRYIRRHKLEISVLGLGHNGHLAINEPGDAFELPSRAVALRPATRKHIGDIGAASGGMTLGISLLLSARRVLLVVVGAHKQQALRKAILGPLTDRVPASVLRLHGDCTVLCTPLEAKLIPAEVLQLG